MPSGGLLVEIEKKKKEPHHSDFTPLHSLNAVRGYISEDDLLDDFEEEIINGLRKQGLSRYPASCSAVTEKK